MSHTSFVSDFSVIPLTITGIPAAGGACDFTPTPGVASINAVGVADPVITVTFTNNFGVFLGCVVSPIVKGGAANLLDTAVFESEDLVANKTLVVKMSASGGASAAGADDGCCLLLSAILL